MNKPLNAAQFVKNFSEEHDIPIEVVSEFFKIMSAISVLSIESGVDKLKIIDALIDLGWDEQNARFIKQAMKLEPLDH